MAGSRTEEERAAGRRVVTVLAPADLIDWLDDGARRRGWKRSPFIVSLLERARGASERKKLGAARS